MKKIMMLALSAALVLSLYACSSAQAKRDDLTESPTDSVVSQAAELSEEDTFMKAIFQNIMSSDQYTEWKKMNPESEFEEKLDGSTITFTVKNEYKSDDFDEDEITNDKPVLNGEYVFTHDGDYIVYTSQDADRLSNPLLVYVEIAILNRYDMTFVEANEYLYNNPDNTYYVVDKEANTVKIYAAAKWNIE